MHIRITMVPQIDQSQLKIMLPSHIAVNKVRKFVGKCIYCHSTENLHDEHVIPESLNGVRLLKKGSCGGCGRITI